MRSVARPGCGGGEPSRCAPRPGKAKRLAFAESFEPFYATAGPFDDGVTSEAMRSRDGLWL